jgi:hypothetical protein
MEQLNSKMHAEVMHHFLNKGHAPTVNDLAKACSCTIEVARQSLKNLDNNHGLILHPNTDEIWVAHPFATQPTNFWVTSGDRSWWGNCIWCSLGIAALVKANTIIETRIGGENKSISLNITNGKLTNGKILAHFTTPIKKAWNNVHYFCGTAMVFSDENQVYDWCKRHAINKGETVPVEQVWDLAKVWYGNHASQTWKKPTNSQANAMFKSVGLDSEFWQLPETEEKF